MKKIARFCFLVSIFVVAITFAPSASRAQSANMIDAALQAIHRDCQVLEENIACYASGAVSATSTGSNFQKPGDIVGLEGLQKLTSEAASEEQWGVSVVKFSEDSGEALTMVLLGEAELTNNFDPAAAVPECFATNLNAGKVNVHTQPNPEDSILQILDPQQSVLIRGENNVDEWYQVEVNDTLGWLRTENIALSCERATLPKISADDVRALYQKPMQQVTLRTGANLTPEAVSGVFLYSPEGEKGQVLLNNVQIDLAGAAFVQSVENDALTITVLQGKAAVAAQGSSVTAIAGQSTRVALSGLVAGAAPVTEDADLGNLRDLFNSAAYGQAYNGPNTTIPGLSLTADVTGVQENDLVRVGISFNGDAAQCAAIESSPVDVVFVLDVPDRLTETRLGLLRSGVAGAIEIVEAADGRYGLVAFRNQAKTVATLDAPLEGGAFEAAFDNAFTTIAREDRGTESAFNTGLSTALSIFKQGGETDHLQHIIVVSDGTGNLEQTQPILNEVLNRNINVVTIGVGDLVNRDFMTALVSDTANFVTAASPIELPTVLQSVTLNLARPAVVNDFALTYSFDGADFELVPGLVENSGGTVGENAVTWSVGNIRQGQVVELPVVLRAKRPNLVQAGLVTVNYTCGEAVPVTSAVTIPSTTGQLRGVVTTRQGVLSLKNTTGAGVLRPFSQNVWALDTNGDQLVSIITGGTEVPPVAVISGSTIEPLYTLDNFDGTGRRLNVFYVPTGGPRWLYLQSASVESSGQYDLTLDVDPIDVTALATLELDGVRLNDQQENAEGRIYNLAAAAGDILTFRYTGESVDLPLKVFSLDGQPSVELYNRYDDSLQQWVSVQAVQGSGPYRVVVKTTGKYGLEVARGDTLTNARGAVSLGQSITQNVVNDNPIVVSYKLKITEANRIGLLISGLTAEPTVLDSNNIRRESVERIEVNSLKVSSFDVEPGEYTLYMEVRGNYGINLTTIEGNLADAVGAFKGSLILDRSLADEIESETPLAIYSLSSGSGKPFFEGDTLTVLMNGVENAGRNTVLIRSSDNVPAEITLDYNQPTQDLYMSVHQLRGQPPYQVIVTGQEQYTVNVVRGDLLSNDKGALVVGQTLNDSSNAPQYLYYTIAPELGKQLVEGDVVTVDFINRSGSNEPFSLPTLTDAGKNPMPVGDNFLVGRRFVGAFELQGQPPYRLVIPNVGAYSIGLEIGNSLLADEGLIKQEDELIRTTEGPQIVEFEFEALANQPYTFNLIDPAQRINSGNDFNLQVRDAADEILLYDLRFSASDSVRDVYSFPENGTYTISFTFDGTYIISIEEGDQISEEKGVFFLGDAEIIALEEDEAGKVLIYQLQIAEPMELSIFRANAGITLYNPNGDVLSSIYSLDKYVSRRFIGRELIYELPDAGTYELFVFASSDYTLRINPTNELVVDKGNIYFDVTEIDKLDDNIRFAEYTIDAPEGETISVQFSMETFQRGRDPLAENTVLMLDADGVPMSVVYRVLDDGYRYLVYDLVGPAPYTLLIQPQRDGASFASASQPQEEYILTVTRGNTARVDKGAISPTVITSEEVIEDEMKVEEGRRTAVYQFTAESPLDLTVLLETEDLADAQSLRVVDSNGEWVKVEESGVSSNDEVVNLYRLPAAGKYTIEFDVTDEYTLDVFIGDFQTADFGTLPINPRNPELTQQVDGDGQLVFDDEGNPVFEDYVPLETLSELNQTQTVAYYTIDAPQNQVISLFVDAGAATITLTDANDKLMPLLDSSANRDNTIFVFQLTGIPPYRLRVDTDSDEITLRVDEGNVLFAELGVLFKNPENPEPQPALDSQGQPEVDRDGNPVFEEYLPITTQTRLESPALVAMYTIEGQPGDIITLQIDQSGNTNAVPILLSADFQLILPRDSVPDGGSITEVYELVGKPPYSVMFVPNNQYTVTLTAGDKLVSDAGALATGSLEVPFEHELALPARIASHTIEVDAGELITVQVTTGRETIPAELVDSEGAILTPEIRLDDDGNVILVYLTSGVAPYKLRFIPDGEYEVAVADGNLVRIKFGFLRYASLITGELADPGLVVTYSVDAKRDDIITVFLQDSNNPTFGQIRDANGKLWDAEAVVEQDNGYYIVYELGGPSPYELVFTAEGEYNLQVFENNVLRAEMGDVPLGQEIEGDMVAPARTAVYTIPAQAGEEITVQLQADGEASFWRLMDAEEQILDPLQIVVKEDYAFGIYTLAGTPPYTLEFNAERDYTLNVSRQNTLIAQKGSFPLNEELNETLEFPQEVVLYEIDRAEGQVVSVALQDDGRPHEFKVTDNEGNELEPDADIEKNNTTYRVYTLKGAAPYIISFTSGGRYRIKTSDGNVLRADQGIIRFGNTATAQLEEPQEAAVYLIDAVPGQLISLVLQDGSRPLSGELIDFNGEEVLPFGQAIINNRDYRTFVLSGTPPYRYVFFPTGRYTLQLEEGNIFRSELGVVPFGGSISNRLLPPIQTAAYTINTETDQIISITIESRGREFVIPKLMNVEGQEIEPLAEVYEGTNTYTGVYRLTGTAPYTLEFATTFQYTLSLARENLTEVELDPIGPQAETVDTQDD